MGTLVELEKNNRINTLLSFYEPLLTEKQKDYITLYYADDLSLGEISETYNISRQAVYDNIRRTEVILEKYEKKLHVAENYMNRKSLYEELAIYIERHYPDDVTIKQIMNQIDTVEE